MVFSAETVKSTKNPAFRLSDKMPDNRSDKISDNTLKDLARFVQAPQFILPWLDRFYEPGEIKILGAVQQTSMDAQTFQKKFGLGHDELARLFKRGVLGKNKQGDLILADFHVRFDIWALFEGFKDLPDEIRNQLNRWELYHYIASHESHVVQLQTTGMPDPGVVTPRYLLMDEAFAVLDQVERIYLWPCNCRSMINGCSKPIYTCLRFDNSQGQGVEISRERAKQIIVLANKKGLMQSGELGYDDRGKLMGAICNCCPDCCFPHLLAREKCVEKIWPLSRYLAQWHEQDCSFCGLCAKRCPFDAFTYDRQAAEKSKRLAFYEDLCRGCGLCAVTCPEKAIEMKKI